MDKKLQFENDYQTQMGTQVKCTILDTGLNVLAGAEDQNNILLWRLTNKTPKMTLSGQQSASSSMLFTQDNLLISGTESGKVHIWDLKKGAEKIKLEGHRQVCTALAMPQEE